MKTLTTAFFLLIASTGLLADVTKEEVRRLMDARVSDTTILAYVQKNGPMQPLTIEDLTELKNAGASDELMRGLLDAGRSRDSGTSAPSPSAYSSGPTTTPSYPQSTYESYDSYYPSTYYPANYSYSYSYPYASSYPYYSYSYPYYSYARYPYRYPYPYYSYSYPYYRNYYRSAPYNYRNPRVYSQGVPAARMGTHPQQVVQPGRVQSYRQVTPPPRTNVPSMAPRPTPQPRAPVQSQAPRGRGHR